MAAGIARDISPLIASLGRTEIETSVGLRPASDVPFPGVVVDLGRAMDPMAYMRHTRDMVNETDIDEGRESICFP